MARLAVPGTEHVDRSELAVHPDQWSIAYPESGTAVNVAGAENEARHAPELLWQLMEPPVTVPDAASTRVTMT